jgi:hypothetical protein
LTTVTLNLTAFANSTAYTLVVSTPNGHAVTVPVVTSGTGTATVTYVPPTGGAHTVNVYLATQAVVATASFNSSGS